MDPIEKRELKRKAWQRLAVQRRRAGILRGRVVVMSLICFAVLWGIVFVQMATGNDPVLSAKEKAVTHAAASARREVETTDERELEPRRSRKDEEGAAGEEIEAEPEAAAEAEEATVGEAEAETVEPEVVETEEPLVTSQS